MRELESSCAVSIVPLPLGELYLGDEISQLHQLVDTVEARLRRVQEETEKST
jgi:hypothetical protein